MTAPEQDERGRWSLRFASAEAEVAFRSWHNETALPYVRVGMLSSLVAWILVVVAVPIADPSAGPSAVILVAPVIAAILAAFGATFLRGRADRAMSLGVLANIIAGIVIVEMSQLVGSVIYMAAGIPIASFIGATVLRQRLVPSALTIGGYTSYATWMVLEAFMADRIKHKDVVFLLLVFVVSVMLSLMAAYVLELVSRVSFAQGRLLARNRRRSKMNGSVQMSSC